MLTAISVLLVTLAAAVLLPVLVLATQVVAAVVRTSQSRAIENQNSSSASASLQICLLMPAHNEEAGLVSVLQALLPQLGGTVKLLVVADNCSDSTAAIARRFSSESASIQVIERHAADQRGKGYALDFGIQHLAHDPPDVVVVVDADCELAPNCVQTLAAMAQRTARPVQALYLMRSHDMAGLKTRFAEFAWVVKNKVRPLGFNALGLPCQLMGTGMAFLWAHISQAKLSSGEIVEDMKLGIELAQLGAPPIFCPQAVVTSYFPDSSAGLKTQRTRWEHGHLGMIVRELPAMVGQAFRRGSMTLLGMALDLLVPPLALLAILVLGIAAFSAGFWLSGGSFLPLLLIGLALAVFATAILLAWYGFGRKVISLVQLLSVPWYIFSKLPMYAVFLVKRQAEWVRTRRSGE